MILLETAHHSIKHGLEHGLSMTIDPDKYEYSLRDIRATFVTLHTKKNLRGCIGTLDATRPLIVDVAHNAYAAAFSDPRFQPLSTPELEQLNIHISVLSIPEPLPCESEQDLLDKLNPGVDGLILEDGDHRATFLPSVWEALVTPKEFLAHLKHKARLPLDYWSETIKFHRYYTEAFPE